MKRLIFIILSFSVIISSCRKPDDFIEGPSLYDVYGDFEIYSPLEGSQINVDFAAGETVHFNCELSKVVNWQLKITAYCRDSPNHLQPIATSYLVLIMITSMFGLNH